MALIVPIKGISPQFGEENWQAANATIVGDVVFGSHCTVWYNAVVRGDVNRIRIGNYSNIQDGAVIHCTYQKTVTSIGDYVSIAHNAIVHGCTIEDGALIGMGAIVLNGAVIGAGTLVAAGAVVPQGMVVPPRSLVAGVPAKVRRELTDAEVLQNLHNGAVYEHLADMHRDVCQ